jgi:hypothetical protein
MKKIFVMLLVLILVQAACNLPEAVPVQTPPSLPAAIETVSPVQTSATTPASTETPLALPSTLEGTPIPTFTPSPTPTETPAANQFFSAVNLSTQVISLTCGTNSVLFEVTPADSKIYSVLLFIRLRYKTTGDRTSWNEGFPMQPVSGKFVYDLKAVRIADFNKFKDPVAWVQFQLVATDAGGAILGRSEVFADRLTLSAVCP